MGLNENSGSQEESREHIWEKIGILVSKKLNVGMSVEGKIKRTKNNFNF